MSPAPTGGGRPAGGASPAATGSRVFDALHLVVLSSFALAQPLFDLLAKNVVFFSARGSTRWDVIVFALGLTLVPPAILVGVEFLVGLVRDRARGAVHLLFVAGLATLIAMQGLNRLGGLDGVPFLLASLAVGIGASAAYARLQPARSILSVLGPAPLVFLGLFLLGSPVSKIAFAGEAQASAVPTRARAPVVMVVFDEFPSTSLMDAKGRIDTVRYPHFGELARSSTWFRNATTVQGNTSLAAPTILSGLLPNDSSKIPIVSDYPRSLFTFLGASYRMNVTEAVTRMCPARLCPQEENGGFRGRMESLASDVSVVYLHLVLPTDLRRRLPSVTTNWGNFRGREGQGNRERILREGLDKRFLQRRLFPSSVQDRDLKWRLFVRSIRPTPKPELDFIHILLPHYGWVYLPSGKRYADGNSTAGLVEDTWTNDPALANQGWQRHLLQVGFVDRLIGELIARLKHEGLWDRALVVVTADHGVSFRPGGPRRLTTQADLADLAFVPLFVKAPGQRQGRVVEQHVQTIDLLPTMADALGVNLPWPVDGRSALSPSYRPSPDVRMFRIAGATASEAFASLSRRRDAVLAERIRLFGAGRSEPGLFGFGPHAELVGRRASELLSGGDSGLSAAAPGEVRYDPEGATAPTLVAGKLEGDGAVPGLDLAVAVNGRIEAVTRSYAAPSGAPAVSVLVPERSFRAGSNRIELYRVREVGVRLTLARIAPAA